MKRNLELTCLVIIAIFFGLNTLCRAEQPKPNKFFSWLSIETSDRQKVISTVNLPALPTPHKIAAEDKITYELYDFGKDFLFLEDEGKPRLPVRYVWFQIPKDAKNINVEVLESQSQIKGNVVIYPAPHRYFETNQEGFPIEKEQFTKDEKVYSQNAFYPQKPAEVVETAFLRQVRMARVAVYPVVFNPQKKQIKHYSYLKIKIAYTSSKENNTVLVDPADPTHKIFSNILPNYSYADAQVSNKKLDKGLLDSPDPIGDIRVLTQQNIINPNFTPRIDYLMICADAFSNPVSANLMNLAQHRVAYPDCYNVGIVSVSNIYTQYPAASHEQSIKNFIQFAYTYWRIDPAIPSLDFILLVGDADYNQNSYPWFLPVWRTNDDPDGTTSDNDYACASGSDDIPDLMIGRLPAKNQTELNTMVTKTINFENNPPQGQNHWGTKNLFLGGYRGGELCAIPSNGARDMLIGHHQESEEYITEDPDSYWQYNSTIAAGYLNNEGALLLTYNGHGDPDCWSPTINISDLNNTNQTPAAVFSFACSTGHFDHSDSDCYGEQWIKLPITGLPNDPKGGSVSFFGSSRFAYGQSLSFDEIILPIIYEDENYLLGSVIQEAKSNTAFYIHNHRKLYNLLGDPALDFSNHIGESTKPELYSSSITLSNNAPSIGEQIAINIQINQNQGLSQANNVVVRLYNEVNNELIQIGNDLITNVPPGGIGNLQQQWTYNGEVSVHFVVKIDPDNTLDELSDYNNHLTGDFYFYLGGPIYVDDSNMSGVEDGSLAHPFNTIQEAFAFEEECRVNTEIITIYVMEGTYGAPNSIISIPSYTYLKGLGNIENIIITDPLVVTGSTYHQSITIEHFTIDLINSSYFSKNNFYYGNDINIIGNIFRNCEYGISTEGAHIINNILYDNGVAIKFAGQGDAYDILNNTIINNGISLSKSTVVSTANLNLENNIIISNGPVALGNITITANYNDSDDPLILNAGQNNINTDPLFTYPAMYDYTLLPNSPCIDAGDPDPIYNDPDGSRNDMGAYGGPEAYEADPITITYPQEGQTTSWQPAIRWDTSGIAPNENLRLAIKERNLIGLPPQESRLRSMYQRYLAALVDFFDIKPAYADVSKHLVKGVVLDKVVPNTGIYNVLQGILAPNKPYRLELSRVSDPDIKDAVNFNTGSNP